MLNLKSLFAILSLSSLLIVVISLVRLATDLWNYYHTSGAANTQLNYRGVGGFLSGLCCFVIFALLHKSRKH